MEALGFVLKASLPLNEDRNSGSLLTSVVV